VYSPPPDPADEQRMRDHHNQAERALRVTCTGDPLWGWGGRTLSRAAATTAGESVWLRLASGPAEQATGKLWTGAELAQAAFGDLDGHRPTLLDIYDQTTGDTAYRAELNEHLDQPVISTDPILRHQPELPDEWWPTLAGTLEKVASATTDRVAVRRAYIERAVPQFLTMPAPEIPRWAVVHGDLHWANLTAPGLRILDWEAWGVAPAGYDEATLYAYSLLQPDTAAQVRRAFPHLGTEETYAAETVVCAELLQTVSRGSNTDLAEPLRAWADQLKAP
jgi:Phosphotransferase enzyme family